MHLSAWNRYTIIRFTVCGAASESARGTVSVRYYEESIWASVPTNAILKPMSLYSIVNALSLSTAELPPPSNPPSPAPGVAHQTITHARPQETSTITFYRVAGPDPFRALRLPPVSAATTTHAPSAIAELLLPASPPNPLHNASGDESKTEITPTRTAISLLAGVMSYLGGVTLLFQAASPEQRDKSRYLRTLQNFFSKSDSLRGFFLERSPAPLPKAAIYIFTANTATMFMLELQRCFATFTSHGIGLAAASHGATLCMLTAFNLNNIASVQLGNSSSHNRPFTLAERGCMVGAAVGVVSLVSATLVTLHSGATAAQGIANFGMFSTLAVRTLGIVALMAHATRQLRSTRGADSSDTSVNLPSASAYDLFTYGSAIALASIPSTALWQMFVPITILAQNIAGGAFLRWAERRQRLMRSTSNSGTALAP